MTRREQEFANALALCLEAIEAGQTLDQCLARYPQFADELAPLLNTANQLRSTAWPALSAGGRVHGRKRMHAALEQKGRSAWWRTSWVQAGLALMLLLFAATSWLAWPGQDWRILQQPSIDGAQPDAQPPTVTAVATDTLVATPTPVATATVVAAPTASATPTPDPNVMIATQTMTLTTTATTAATDAATAESTSVTATPTTSVETPKLTKTGEPNEAPSEVEERITVTPASPAVTETPWATATLMTEPTDELGDDPALINTPTDMPPSATPRPAPATSVPAVTATPILQPTGTSTDVPTYTPQPTARPVASPTTAVRPSATPVTSTEPSATPEEDDDDDDDDENAPHPTPEATPDDDVDDDTSPGETPHPPD
jgi:hypothetical protein